MRRVIGIFSVACVACVSTGASTMESPTYSVSSLLSEFQEKKIEDGQLVAVSGYLTFGDDKHNVWESKIDYDHVKVSVPSLGDPAWKKCISLTYYGRFRKILLKYNGKQVRIFGYISRQIPENDEINLGSCNEIGISLEGDGARVLAH